MLSRENFIESVFVYRRWRDTVSKFTADHLVNFHTKHKLLLRTHSENHYRELGRIVAQAGNLSTEDLLTSYQGNLVATMKLRLTVKKHVNVLMHRMGYFKRYFPAMRRKN